MAIIHKFFFNLKAITFCLFFCSSWNNSNGQELLKGKIIDENHKPVSIASIEYINNTTGVFSDSIGEFSLPKIIGDSIKITIIGFQPKVVPIESRTSNLIIQLETKTFRLNEVVIKNRKKTKNTITIGHFIKERITTFSNKLHPDLHRAVYIPNTLKLNGYIDEILFQLDGYKDKHAKLRIRVLSVHSVTGFPEEDLLLTENILEPVKFKKINKFSIKSHNIQMPLNGIYISFEWLPNDQKLTNDDIPWIIGNDKADRPYIMDNLRYNGWKQSKIKSSTSEGYLVPGVSINVSY
jgi:hypothetical protein